MSDDIVDFLRGECELAKQDGAHKSEAMFRKAADELERLRAIVEARAWRDATTVDPADGDRLLVAIRGSDDGAVWWDSEVVTVHRGENYFMLELDGGSWDCEWADIAWCIPMSAMQLPEAAEAAEEKKSNAE